MIITKRINKNYGNDKDKIKFKIINKLNKTKFQKANGER